MARDKSWDKIFINNFFRDRLTVYTRDQPSEEAYETYYWLATNDWRPMKQELDSYPIPQSIKNDLIILFDLAYHHNYYVGDESVQSIKAMKELWEKMRRLAISIRASAKSYHLYTD